MKFYEFGNMKATGLVKALYTPMGIGKWGLNDPNSQESYEALGREFTITPSDMIRTKQLHTAAVRVVGREHGGEGVIRPITAEGFDGLITDEPGLMLCTVEADCTPVYLLDPVHKAIAMLHSGWKGTAGRISANAISLMEETYGTKPEDVIAAIGPCICPNCYEVSDDLIPPFKANFTENQVKELFTAKPNGKYWLDLKKAVRITLNDAGVSACNIEDSGYCTYHDNLFYSWRRDKNPDVRMLTAIMLN